MATWPDAYLQPDPKEDCGYYVAAYICRALGHADATAEAAKAFRDAGKHELHYPEQFGVERDGWFQHIKEPLWYLGPLARGWVCERLDAGQVGRAIVWRTTEMAHAVAVLEDRGDAGVLLMDPGRGLIVEPWKWFLSIGPGGHSNVLPMTHMMDAWYWQEGLGDR